MFWGRRGEKLRRKRRKIIAEGNYIFCRGEEKRRRKRRKIFGEGNDGDQPTRGKIKAICGYLGHCSLLFKSDPNVVYSPPNAVYWLQCSFQRSSLLSLLSFAASPPFKPEKNNTSFLLSPSGDLGLV